MHFVYFLGLVLIHSSSQYSPKITYKLELQDWLVVLLRQVLLFLLYLVTTIFKKVLDKNTGTMTSNREYRARCLINCVLTFFLSVMLDIDEISFIGTWQIQVLVSSPLLFMWEVHATYIQYSRKFSGRPNRDTFVDIFLSHRN